MFPTLTNLGRSHSKIITKHRTPWSRPRGTPLAAKRLGRSYLPTCLTSRSSGSSRWTRLESSSAFCRWLQGLRKSTTKSGQSKQHAGQTILWLTPRRNIRIVSVHSRRCDCRSQTKLSSAQLSGCTQGQHENARGNFTHGSKPSQPIVENLDIV